MFVDVEVKLKNSTVFIHRTRVVKRPSGTWSAMPNSGAYELLFTGLDAEPPSTQVVPLPAGR
jgi:hypothetical protein